MWKAKVKDQLLVHMYVWSLLCGREVSIQVRLERMVFMAKNNLRSDLRVYDFKKIFMAGVCTSSRVFERGRDPCSRRSSQRSSLNTSQILLSLSHWSHSKGTKASLIRIGWSHQPVPAVNLSLKSVHMSNTIYNPWAPGSRLPWLVLPPPLSSSDTRPGVPPAPSLAHAGPLPHEPMPAADEIAGQQFEDPCDPLPVSGWTSPVSLRECCPCCWHAHLPDTTWQRW